MGLPRRAIGWTVTGLFTLGVVPVVQQYVVKITEEWGWYDKPTQKAGAVTAFFATVTDTVWFYPALSFVAGIAISYWIFEWLLPPRAQAPPAEPELIQLAEAARELRSRAEHTTEVVNALDGATAEVGLNSLAYSLWKIVPLQVRTALSSNYAALLLTEASRMQVILRHDNEGNLFLAKRDPSQFIDERRIATDIAITRPDLERAIQFIIEHDNKPVDLR